MNMARIDKYLMVEQNRRKAIILKQKCADRYERKLMNPLIITPFFLCKRNMILYLLCITHSLLYWLKFTYFFAEFY